MIEHARFRLGAAIAIAVALASAWGARALWHQQAEKRVRVVDPGRLIRGAWQSPDALRTIIAREHVKTIVTLTAINRDDPKYVSQANVVVGTGVGWFIVPMRGSRATLAQMARAADLMADPALQPVFFHCVAGHHRTSLAHAAYLIRHCGWTGQAAASAMARLPWARPAADSDQNDRALIEEFAALQHHFPRAVEEDLHESDDGDKTALAP